MFVYPLENVSHMYHHCESDYTL